MACINGGMIICFFYEVRVIRDSKAGFQYWQIGSGLVWVKNFRFFIFFIFSGCSFPLNPYTLRFAAENIWGMYTLFQCGRWSLLRFCPESGVFAVV